MTHNITINGVNRSGVIKRVNFDYAESAVLGEAGNGRVVIDDEDGDIAVPGFKNIHANETDSTPARIFTGFAHRKGIRRGVFATEASREYELATLDGNDLLRRRIIRGTDGKRPKETITKRTNWLLSHELTLVDVFDFGRVDTSSVKLDKMDHRGQYPLDVLTAMAKSVSWNFYVRWNDDEDEWELVFRNDNTSTDDTCTLEISNSLDDIDDITVFEPFTDAELSQDPQDVYSGAYGTGAKNRVYETKSSTADDFVARDGITEDAGIRADSTLSRDARRFLNNSDTELQVLPLTIQVPRAKVGLVQAGQRILTRMTHMEPEGWDPAIYARILRLRRSQPTNTDDLYNLRLELSPQEPGAGGGSSCPYEATEAGTYYPLGGYHSADVPPTPNISNGPMYYLRPGIFYPTVPTEDFQGLWHFGLYGDDVWGVVQPGGPGTIDWAGDCASNELRWIFVGPGHFSLQTEIYVSGIRPMAAYYGSGPAGSDEGYQVFSSGDLLEIDLTGDCVNIIHVMDGPGSPCGGKWGWSVAEWTPA